MSKKHYIIPIFVPHRGCPNDCVFCNQTKITGLSTDLTKDDVERIIRDHLKTIPKKNTEIEVSFFGGSFTGIDMSIQETFLSIAKNYKNKGLIHKIRLSTRPDYIDIKKLNLLKKYDVDIIELGVQSLDEEVLEKSLRGHSVKDVKKAVCLIKQYGFELGLQMMVGLVGDTKEKSLKTGKEIVSLNPNLVRIYPTLVVNNTHLEKMYLSEEYKPLGLEDAIDVSADLLMLFNYYDIKVIRIGLQPTENISLNKDVVAGPFHPSFRQLVETEVYRRIIDMYLYNLRDNIRELTIIVNRKEVNNIVGHKAKNIKYFKSKDTFHKIKIEPGVMPKEYFAISYNETYEKLIKRKYIQNYLIKRNLLN